MVIYLVYASTSGNVESTMEFVGKVLKKKGFEIYLSRAEETSIDVIKNHKRFVLGTSTWDHGKLNPFFSNLYKEMQAEKFDDKQAAFVGLGDRRYEPVLFCEGIIKLRQLWLGAGGEEIVPTLKIQGEPYEQLEPVVLPWANNLSKIWAEYNE
jgi:flavodoxin